MNKAATPDEAGQFATHLRAALGEARMAIDVAEHRRRIDYALSLSPLSASYLADRCCGERIAIVGSGPSLAGSLERLHTFGGKIIAVNAAHDYLLDNGITPTFGVLLDPREWVAGYQRPTKGVAYLVGSTVHPRVWQRFMENGIKPWLFVPIMTDTEHKEIALQYADEICFIAGATTVGMRAISIAMHLGASAVELHGFDSCYAPGEDGVKKQRLYAHPKPATEHDARRIALTSRLTGDMFSCVTNGPMARQIIGFAAVTKGLHLFESNGRVGKCRIIVAGDGAIPWMAWKDGGPNYYLEHLNPDAMRAKYGATEHWDYCANQPVENAA